MLLSVAKRLNLSPAEILVVGDRITDVQCAINAGNRAVVVSTQTKQSELDAIKAQFPDVPVIKRFDDVLALLTLPKRRWKIWYSARRSSMYCNRVL